MYSNPSSSRPYGNQAIFGPAAINNNANQIKPAPTTQGFGSQASGFGSQANKPVASSTSTQVRGNPAIFGTQASSNANSNSSGLKKITLDELSEHDTAKSLWIGYKGYVYDATDYKHSGGAQALLRGAGIDATQKILRQHSYVKVDEILKNKIVGILVIENHGESDDDED